VIAKHWLRGLMRVEFNKFKSQIARSKQASQFFSSAEVELLLKLNNPSSETID